MLPYLQHPQQLPDQGNRRVQPRVQLPDSRILAPHSCQAATLSSIQAHCLGGPHGPGQHADLGAPAATCSKTKASFKTQGQLAVLMLQGMVGAKAPPVGAKAGWLRQAQQPHLLGLTRPPILSTLGTQVREDGHPPSFAPHSLIALPAWLQPSICPD